MCAAGGYLEANVRMPGDTKHSGLWPAIFLMGNLGRAGYTRTTGGIWPFSYNTCDAAAGKVPWSKLPGMKFSPCEGKGESMGAVCVCGWGGPTQWSLHIRVHASCLMLIIYIIH